MRFLTEGERISAQHCCWTTEEVEEWVTTGLQGVSKGALLICGVPY